MTRTGWSLPAKVRRNLGWKLLGTGIEKGLRLLLVLAAARLMGPAAWGRYTYSFALAMLLVQLTDMGLALFLNREIARAGRADPDLVGQVLSLKALLAAGYLAAVAGLAHSHGDEPVVAIAIAICGGVALCSSAIEAIVHVFRGIQDLSLEARAHGVHAFAALVTGGAALIVAMTVFGREFGAGSGGQGEDATLLLYAAGLLIASLIGLGYALILLRRVTEVRLGVTRDLLRRFSAEVLPLGVAIVASMIYYRIDVPMIRNMLPADVADHETGLYTAGYKLLEHMALVPAILMAAAFPALSETVTRDLGRARSLHATTLRWLVLAGLAGAGVFLVAPDLIIRLLYGARFAGSAPIMLALAPCVVLTFVNYLETHMLVALGLVKAQMLISLTLIGVNVTLNWFWIPRWHGTGAAWATACTELCLLFAVAPMVWHRLRAPNLVAGTGPTDALEP